MNSLAPGGGIFFQILNTLPLKNYYPTRLPTFFVFFFANRFGAGFLINSVFNSASISAIVGKLVFNFLGKTLNNSNSEIPIGLLTSRNAYSAMTRSFFSQSNNPIVGLS